MKKLILSACASIVALSVTPASAAVLVCGKSEMACYGSVDEDDPGNVLINKNSSPVTGTIATGLGVLDIGFTSTTDVLTAPSNGQARVESADGILNGLTFTIETGYTFASALFNLKPLTGPSSPTKSNLVVISYLAPGAGMQSQTINTNGQNFLRVFGDAGERFTSIGFVSSVSDAGVLDLRQLRLDGIQAISAVPEPATWTLMILGIGAVGATLRRRKSSTALRHA